MQLAPFRSIVLLALFVATPSCGGETKSSNESAASKVGTGGLDASPGFAKGLAGYSALNAGKFDEALRLYDELLVLEPGNLPARINRSVALTMLGRNADALVAIDDCVKRDPNDPEIHINRGQILFNLTRHQEALEAVETSIRITGSNPSQTMFKSNMLKGRILVELGRGPEAVAVLDQLDRLAPNQPQILMERAQVYDRLGRRADADPIWASLTQSFPNEAAIQQAFAARPPAGSQ